MADDQDELAISLPRQIWTELAELSPELTDRMHELLYKNTDDLLNAEERRELHSLVQMFNFAQLLRSAMLSKS